jgi:hypothetical protein
VSGRTRQVALLTDLVDSFQWGFHVGSDSGHVGIGMGHEYERSFASYIQLGGGLLAGERATSDEEEVCHRNVGPMTGFIVTGLST